MNQTRKRNNYNNKSVKVLQYFTYQVFKYLFSLYVFRFFFCFQTILLFLPVPFSLISLWLLQASTGKTIWLNLPCLACRCGRPWSCSSMSSCAWPEVQKVAKQKNKIILNYVHAISLIFIMYFYTQIYLHMQVEAMLESNYKIFLLLRIELSCYSMLPKKWVLNLVFTVSFILLLCWSFECIFRVL